MLKRRPRSLLITCGALVVALGTTVTALAQGGPEPREIALAPDDLSPGFRISPSESRTMTLPDGSALYYVVLGQNDAPANLLYGLVVVQQSVIRIAAQDTNPAEILARSRSSLLQRKYQPTDEGPNDDSAFSLKQQTADLTQFAVGFVSHNFVVVTELSGPTNLVRFADVQRAVDVTSAKLEAARAR